MIFEKLFRKKSVTGQSAGVMTATGGSLPVFGDEYMGSKLAVVNRCLDVISDSLAKMPTYAILTKTRERVYPPVLDLLNLRPNPVMTPAVRRKMLELNRLITGAAYEWIVRDPATMEPVELIPIPSGLVYPWQDTEGRVWYDVSHPYTLERMRLASEDILHYKGYTTDGLHCVSILQRASEVIQAGRAAQVYQGRYYASGGQPLGVLETDADLDGFTKKADGTKSDVTKKEALRKAWEEFHAGPDNAFRIAVLDRGLKYNAITVSMADAQFVENHDVTVQDICNFFGVPLYKANAGKQSYSSNEQNAIEYVTGTLHPILVGYEQEQTWKLLNLRQIHAGMELHTNMMAELRGDNASRGSWYQTMTEMGAYSVNDVRLHEDLPDVPGGEQRKASLNYVPLEDWKQLSEKRNGTGEGGENHE